jgi:hypothetical protein
MASSSWGERLLGILRRRAWSGNACVGELWILHFAEGGGRGADTIVK